MPNCLTTFKVCVLSCIVLLTLKSFGQCPVSNFTVDASVCRNESVAVSNLSTNATNYYWDFCSDDLLSAPTASVLNTSSSIVTPYGYKTVFDNGKWYGFISDRGSKKIVRVDFGTDLENPSPTYVDLT